MNCDMRYEIQYLQTQLLHRLLVIKNFAKLLKVIQWGTCKFFLVFDCNSLSSTVSQIFYVELEVVVVAGALDDM